MCLCFYGGVFPFLKFATKLMVFKYGVDETYAGWIPSLMPFGTIILTPLFGSIYDKIGKGATLMLIGSLILTMVHVFSPFPYWRPLGSLSCSSCCWVWLSPWCPARYGRLYPR